MKNLNLLRSILIICCICSLSTATAQVNVNVNIGAPPTWAPVGYEQAEYYYIPDIESYYDVPHKHFIYLHNGVWVRTRQLPPQYRNYDLYNGYKVVLTDYHGSTPYTYYETHKAKYYKGYRGAPQRTIGPRPVIVKEHIKYQKIKENHGHGHEGHGNGHDEGHGKDKH